MTIDAFGVDYTSDTLPKKTILRHANIMLLLKGQLLLFYLSTTGEIFPETVELSGKIRSQVLQLALETNCTCGFHLIA